MYPDPTLLAPCSLAQMRGRPTRCGPMICRDERSRSIRLCSLLTFFLEGVKAHGVQRPCVKTNVTTRQLHSLQVTHRPQPASPSPGVVGRHHRATGSTAEDTLPVLCQETRMETDRSSICTPDYTKGRLTCAYGLIKKSRSLFWMAALFRRISLVGTRGQLNEAGTAGKKNERIRPL